MAEETKTLWSFFLIIFATISFLVSAHLSTPLVKMQFTNIDKEIKELKGLIKELNSRLPLDKEHSHVIIEKKLGDVSFKDTVFVGANSD